MATQPSIAVIGAGMAGVAAAHRLRDEGYTVRIIEANDRVGGRCATYRSGDAIFDYGAQYFTVRDPRFQSYVDDWLGRGIVTEWSRGFPGPDGEPRIDDIPRYCGTKGMDGMAADMVAGMDVRLDSKVDRIAAKGRQWEIWTTNFEVFLADAIVMTVPMPFVAKCIDAPPWGTLVAAETLMKPIRYKPTLTLMVELDGPSAIPEPGAIDVKRRFVDWIADNHRKGISPGCHTITIHAETKFSKDCFDASDSMIAKKLLKVAERWIGSGVRMWRVRRWQHAAPKTTTDDLSCVMSADPAPIVFAGDGFCGPRVEGAFVSGLEAAQTLIDQLSSR